MAKESGKTRSRFVSEVLAAHVAGVSLSDQDRKEIAEFIERAKLAREEKRNNS